MRARASCFLHFPWWSTSTSASIPVQASKSNMFVYGDLGACCIVRTLHFSSKKVVLTHCCFCTVPSFILHYKVDDIIIRYPMQWHPDCFSNILCDFQHEFWVTANIPFSLISWSYFYFETDIRKGERVLLVIWAKEISLSTNLFVAFNIWLFNAAFTLMRVPEHYPTFYLIINAEGISNSINHLTYSCCFVFNVVSLPPSFEARLALKSECPMKRTW